MRMHRVVILIAIEPDGGADRPIRSIGRAIRQPRARGHRGTERLRRRRDGLDLLPAQA